MFACSILFPSYMLGQYKTKPSLILLLSNSSQFLLSTTSHKHSAAFICLSTYMIFVFIDQIYAPVRIQNSVTTNIHWLTIGDLVPLYLVPITDTISLPPILFLSLAVA